MWSERWRMRRVQSSIGNMARRWRSAILAALLACFGMHASAAWADAGYRIALEVPGRPVTALYAEESGDGPPLILLHGLGGSLFTWRHVVAALARSHRVIALDLKGFGQSDKPFDEHYSAADQADLVSAFIRKRGLSGVILVGHSFGGVVALRTARDFAREPGVIARLVVMDTPALQQDLSDGDWFFSVPGLPYMAMAVTPPEFMTRMMLRLVSAPGRVVPESDVRGYAAPFYDLGSRHAFIATGQSIIDTNGPKMGLAYRRIEQPTLVVWCRRDRIVPVATGRRLARVLPNAQLAILNKCNHLPQDEVPGALLSTLLPFLDH
jgi:pimeloyl-ACP methyl ester carboxylesterase